MLDKKEGTLQNPIDVGPGEYPFYEDSDLATKDQPTKLANSGNLNASSIMNIQVSNIAKPSPNTIIPLDNTGKLPVSVIPSSGGGGSSVLTVSILGGFL